MFNFHTKTPILVHFGIFGRPWSRNFFYDHFVCILCGRGNFGILCGRGNFGILCGRFTILVYCIQINLATLSSRALSILLPHRNLSTRTRMLALVQQTFWAKKNL
jgi:hypothetical protein